MNELNYIYIEILQRVQSILKNKNIEIFQPSKEQIYLNII